MANTSTDTTVVLGLAYPVAFVISYLTASIVLKVRDIRGHSNACAKKTKKQRTNLIFGLLCFLCIDFVSKVKPFLSPA
jgi:hypothetical protein